MSCPVKLQALPAGVLEAVFTPENFRRRTSTNPLTPLSFPKSRSALWDGSPAGDTLRLHLCSHRKPRLVLMEKALRLAQRHARQSNKPRLHGFFLGSVSVDADEEGVTVTLDRFDPGRDQAGASGRVPSALLPGDVLVPVVFSTQTENTTDAVVQSEAELHHCFKVLQQCVSSRQAVDVCQLIKVRGRACCSQQSESFSLSWSAVCPSVFVDVEPVRSVPVIPTALLRSLSSADRPPHASHRQRGFLTMDQTRKLLLLLESDPKACSLPLVGLWLSGVTHIYSPQVWAWCLRFLFSAALQDRVLSESRSFLLVLFGSTHRAPQFFQCRGPGPGPGPGPQLDYQLLTASQYVTLYQQVVSVQGQTLQCELGPEDHGRQTEVFRDARTSYNSAAGLSVSDQDSGVEDEDLSPRPSPSPHPPAQQTRRVQPSVPELSLLIDSSFTTNQGSWQDPGSAHRPPPPAADRKSAPPTGNTTSSSSAPRPPPPAAPADRKSAPPTGNTTSSAPRPAPPPHLHSTPNSNLQQPCTCCSTHTYDCTSIFSSPGLHPAPPPSSHHHHTPPPCSLHPAPPPAHSHPHTPPFSHHPITPSVPSSSTHSAPLSSHHRTPPPSHSPSSPLSSHHHTPPPSTRLSAPPLPSTLLPPPPVQWCGDSPSPHPPCRAEPAPPPWLPRPPCVNQCCDPVGGVVPSDTYQLLLHQDRQLRLLQAQVQMLLEAQGKLQFSSRQVDTQTPRSTASIAVGTGASLFWGDPVQPLPHQEVQAPPPSSLSPPSSPSPAAWCPPSPPSSCRQPSHADLSVIRSVGGAEDSDITHQEATCSPSGQHSGLQSPVLGESVSMCGPADEQQSFYHELMNQLTSRLQESDSRQEVAPASSQSPPRAGRRRPGGGGDPVVSATVRRLQQLGVDVDEDLSESDRRKTESSSTLASINPAAVLSRLSVSEPTTSCLFPGGSVDLSLEANAIALRYLSDSQLSRLSLGGHAPRPAPSNDSLMSPSNMSLATRKYMRRYGLIEEEDSEEEQKVDVQEALARQPLTEALNVKLLPQSQLIRDLRPKMQLLAGGTEPNAGGKENCSRGRPSLMRASSLQAEGSVGNILDLSRLRQLPKLF